VCTHLYIRSTNTHKFAHIYRPIIGVAAHDYQPVEAGQGAERRRVRDAARCARRSY
jgi:hypothetical protein